jgi:hypothetical protein
MTLRVSTRSLPRGSQPKSFAIVPMIQIDPGRLERDENDLLALDPKHV